MIEPTDEMIALFDGLPDVDVYTGDTVPAILRDLLAIIERDHGIGDDRHVLELRYDGWTLQHPMRCRPNLHQCPANPAASVMDIPAPGPGRFVLVERTGIDGPDRFVLGERLPDEP